MENNSKVDTEKSQAKMVAEAVREDRISMPYISASSCIPIGAVVPTKLSYETVEALNKFIQNNIDTAEFVREKLGYVSRLSVCEAFASEQVDALALAIVQIENGKGFILGDMAGIGKGRVVAGVLRYAHQIGKVPIFMTIASSLFSDIYRDLYDIGGFSGTPPVHNLGELPNPFIFNEDGVVQRVVSSQKDPIDLFSPHKTKVTVELCQKNKGRLPLNMDLILLTYSQLSQDIRKVENVNAIAKYDYLQSIAPNSIFVLDESHKGAGDGNIGSNIYDLLALAKGVMFSSATYSKVPKSMLLYIPKTDINDSKIRPDTIEEAVAENGEAIQEYIASLLVKSGQMIRRERTFDKCKIEYQYPPSSTKLKYFAIYDQVMSLYNEIEAFSKSQLYKDSIFKAIDRIAKENKVVILDTDKDGEKPSNDTERREWEAKHKNKYTYSFPTTNVIKSRFQWIENLLFSIKADFVTDEVIRLLKIREDVDYTEGDKSYVKTTNYKPIIAVRNTSEASLNTLGYKVGDKLTPEENDYAKTLINIANSLVSATLTFNPVNPSRKKIVLEKATVIDEDFSDNGARFNQISDKMKNATSGLPLSPIDYMTNKIEATQRETWDYEHSSSPTYKVEEITKRSMAIKQVGDGFEIQRIESQTATEKVARFNSGESDVILINTAGSTGLSLHSKWDFDDRRPRVMLIHQVELDVATEVQKRGRINRTGQVNNPAYTYIVSVIPSEVRKLLMLRRKLRSLDATTTGNVKQSAKASQILDAEGNDIEDMSNKYGYQSLLEFINEAGNEKYEGLVDKKWWDKRTSPDKLFENYLREVEKLPCGDPNNTKRANQEEFYNLMNANYVKLKKRLEEAGEWDLETAIEDLKTSTLNKRKLFEGNNKNEFTKSVYIEDKYTTPKGKPLTKEELNDRMEELNYGKDYTKYFNQVIDEYDTVIDKKVADIKSSFGDPDTTNAKSKAEKDKIIAEHKDIVDSAIMDAKFKMNKIKNYMIFFKPNNVVHIPLDTDILSDGAKDQNGNRKGLPYHVGIVVGYKFLGKSDVKFSPMNIEIHLASTSKIKPYMKITFTKQYEPILEWITMGRVHPKEVAEAREWTVGSTIERDKMRVLTGELFKAFEITNELFSSDGNYKRRKRLIKYSTTAGTVETGIRLWQEKYIDITKGKTPTFAPINSDAFIKQLGKLQEGSYFWLPSKKEMFGFDGRLYTFNICLGLYPTGKGTERKNADKNYLSEFATTETSMAITNATGINSNIIQTSLYMHSEGTEVWKFNMKFISFKFSKADGRMFLDYLNEKLKVLMEIVGKDEDYVIREMPDTYVESGEAKGEEGVYQYYPLLRFDPKSTPPNYIEGSFKDTEENDYGIFSLKYPLSFVQASLFRCVPANISETQAVRNILVMIGEDDKRVKYIQDVKDLKDDYYGISLLTQSVVGIPTKYAIGLVDNESAGEIIARNIDNPTPTEKKVEVTSKEEREKDKISLDWNTAQDFIIQLKSL